MAVENNTIGPRAQFFAEQCEETTKQIKQNLLLILAEANTLSPDAFTNKYISKQRQGELKNLDERTKTLFKNIIYDVMADFQKEGMLMNFIMLSMSRNDFELHGKLIKEAALPAIKSLVATLDLNDKGIIDEAVSGGVSDVIKTLLEIHCMDF